MPEQPEEAGESPAISADGTKNEGRRPILRKLGRFAAVTPPAVILLLAAATKPAKASAPSVL